MILKDLIVDCGCLALETNSSLPSFRQWKYITFLMEEINFGYIGRTGPKVHSLPVPGSGEQDMFSERALLGHV